MKDESTEPIRNQAWTPNIIIHLHRLCQVAQLSGGLAVRLAHIMIVSTTVGTTKAAGSGKGEKQRRINFGFSHPDHRRRRRRRRHSHRCNLRKKQRQIEQTRNKGPLGVTCESPLRRLLTLLSVMGARWTFIKPARGLTVEKQ
ncbi:unnamed protein product [Lasius platythorax]|uniref:Uncharacterized protein n=1 Tax=Lasius platythorax TaxID=488582 RepID=A0AAV2NC35_9HYME